MKERTGVRALAMGHQLLVTGSAYAIEPDEIVNGPDVAAALNDPKWAARNTTLCTVSGLDLSLDQSRVALLSLSLSPCGTYYSDGEWCENNSARIRPASRIANKYTR